MFGRCWVVGLLFMPSVIELSASTSSGIKATEGAGIVPVDECEVAVDEILLWVNGLVECNNSLLLCSA